MYLCLWCNKQTGITAEVQALYAPGLKFLTDLDRFGLGPAFWAGRVGANNYLHNDKCARACRDARTGTMLATVSGLARYYVHLRYLFALDVAELRSCCPFTAVYMFRL